MDFPLSDDEIVTLVAELDRLTTATADLQQRLDAAEEALKVAQGEVKRLTAHASYVNDLLDATEHGRKQAAEGLRVAKLELEAQTKEARNAIDVGTAYGYRAEKAESALTAANSRVERLREALGYYAEIRGYVRNGIYIHEVAQKALADDAKEGM